MYHASNSKPDVVYAHIEKNPDQVSTVNDLYANASSKTNEGNPEAVIYSEIKGNDIDVHTVAPSGDVYAQVQKR